MRKSISTFLILVVVLCCTAQKLTYPKIPKSTNNATVIGKIKYPQQFKYEGNPVSRMHSAADPDAHVWGDEVWVYTSQDRWVDSTKHKHHYDAMDGYHAFSSKDMINWTDHGEVFHSSDVPWAWEKGGFLWAPGNCRNYLKV